jgi:alkanesulfonate monooxygenase SsuD/methylene tetrahydromethanopterin reductase-like flavin-dependent oxidoreductase (luciferase family)
MRTLWTQEQASYQGEFVSFGPSWAWPKPVQSSVPVLIGAAGTEKTFRWIAGHADGWITTPREEDVTEGVRRLRQVWTDAGRTGSPRVVALAVRPDQETLERWSVGGVSDVVYGLPDRAADDIPGYLDRLAARLEEMRPGALRTVTGAPASG